MTDAAGTKDLLKTWQAIEEFRKLDPEIPTQTVNTFLYAALHEGCTMRDLATALGVAQSTMSRNVSALSKVHRSGRPGLDLVRRDPDPYERRRVVVTLTPRGKKFLTGLLSILEN
jgi:DNA-binding MarR family transcriptional regulator